MATATERFQAKWKPARVEKTRQIKNLEPRFDSIETEKALDAPTMVPEQAAIPTSLFNLCFVLFVIQATFFPTAYFAHWWIFDDKGLGIPTDFVNVWSAGRLVLDGHAAQAYDWDIQKQVQVAVLGQSYPGNFAWHYPPPFLFVASLLAHFPYAAAW